MRYTETFSIFVFGDLARINSEKRLKTIVFSICLALQAPHSYAPPYYISNYYQAHVTKTVACIKTDYSKVKTFFASWS